MLRLSIHAGALRGATRYNRLAWLDIGYERLAPVAIYKVVLFETGAGAKPPVTLKDYPRWSASLWDLTARAIALALSEDSSAPKEVPPMLDTDTERRAFACGICALIEHLPAGDENRRVTLACAEVLQEKRMRGTYRGRFEEDTMPLHCTAPFVFKPHILRPTELLLRAALVRLTGDLHSMPPRPRLSVPAAVVKDGFRLYAWTSPLC